MSGKNEELEILPPTATEPAVAQRKPDLAGGLISAMAREDLYQAIRLTEIGNYTLARMELQNALEKLDQLEALNR